MTQHPDTLARFYRGWDEYQRMLVQAVAPLSTEALALRVAPSQWSAGRIAAHIVATRVGWFQGLLGEGDPALAEYDPGGDADDAPPRAVAELVSGLQATWAMVEECLNRWTPGMLTDTFTTHHGQERSRQWVLWHVLEHDIHHGGELLLTLGSGGVATPEM